MDFETEVAELEKVWRTYVSGESAESQLARWRQREPDVEVRISAPTVATQEVIGAVCKRYGLQLYRRPRLHRTTVCLRVPGSFMDVVLNPLIDNMAQVVEDAALRTTTEILEGWEERVFAE